MLIFIFCFVGGFIIARKIQDYRIQKLTEQMIQLEHQKQMMQTGNPFWGIMPQFNRDNNHKDENET